jgi:hypothetical protein
MHARHHPPCATLSYQASMQHSLPPPSPPPPTHTLADSPHLFSFLPTVWANTAPSPAGNHTIQPPVHVTPHSTTPGTNPGPSSWVRSSRRGTRRSGTRRRGSRRRGSRRRGTRRRGASRWGSGTARQCVRPSRHSAARVRPRAGGVTARDGGGRWVAWGGRRRQRGGRRGRAMGGQRARCLCGFKGVRAPFGRLLPGSMRWAEPD